MKSKYPYSKELRKTISFSNINLEEKVRDGSLAKVAGFFSKQVSSYKSKIAKVRKVLAMMKPIQKERLCKVVLLGLSSRKIAQEEGVNYNAVDKSIKAAKKNFKKYYENL